MQYNVLEARNQLSKLIDAAMRGEEVVIAKRGEPAVRLAPVALPDEIEERPGNPAWIAQWFKDNPVNPAWAMTSDEVDDYIDQERDSWR